MTSTKYSMCSLSVYACSYVAVCVCLCMYVCVCVCVCVYVSKAITGSGRKASSVPLFNG